MYRCILYTGLYGIHECTICIGIWLPYCIHSGASNLHLLTFSIHVYTIYRSKQGIHRDLYTVYTGTSRSGRSSRSWKSNRSSRSGRSSRSLRSNRTGRSSRSTSSRHTTQGIQALVYIIEMHIRVNILYRSGTQAYSNLRFSTQPKPDYQPSGGSALNLSLMFSTTTMEVQHKN